MENKFVNETESHNDGFVRVSDVRSRKNLKKLVKQIQVDGYDDEDVAVVNNSGLEMIGKGRQGAVFKLNDDACMKVYGEIDDCNREYHAMMLGKNTDLLPRVFSKGTNFLTMEMVYGVDLREYLQSQPLTKELSVKLIEMLQTFKQIGYERIDHHKRQIFLQQDGSLKVIDVGRTIWRNRTYPYPRKLLTSLGPTCKQVFMEHVKELAPDLYEEWQHYIAIDQEARQLFETIVNEVKVDQEHLNTKKMLTTSKKKKYNYHLEQLVRKVVKEERELIGEKVQQMDYMVESIALMEAEDRLSPEDLPIPPTERQLPTINSISTRNNQSVAEPTISDPIQKEEEPNKENVEETESTSINLYQSEDVDQSEEEQVATDSVQDDETNNNETKLTSDDLAQAENVVEPEEESGTSDPDPWKDEQHEEEPSVDQPSSVKDKKSKQQESTDEKVNKKKQRMKNKQNKSGKKRRKRPPQKSKLERILEQKQQQRVAEKKKTSKQVGQQKKEVSRRNSTKKKSKLK